MKKIDETLLKAFEFMMLDKSVRVTKEFEMEYKDFVSPNRKYSIMNINYEGELEIIDNSGAIFGGVKISEIIF